MKLGSLFDGSGGFPLAGSMFGIEPVWASEIEPFPIRVTKLRFPEMKHLGSVTDVNGAEVEPVDIITFGSPCQDLSVAGKQAGIHDGQRSKLFFEAIRIIKEMRDATSGKYPRFAVWENVPGAFSSNKGEDFRAVLQAFCSIWGGQDHIIPQPPRGRWMPAGCVVGNGSSLAWRVYDAQFWGVPQRRKRIYLVADFGSERAGEILFESESMSGVSEQSGEAGESASRNAQGSTGRSYLSFAWANAPDAGLSLGEKSPPTKATRNGEPAMCCLNDQGGAVMDVDDKAGCLRAQEHGHQPVVIYDARGNGEGGVCPTITGDHNGHISDYTAIAVSIGNGQLQQMGMETVARPLDCMHDQQAIIEQAKPPRKYIVRRLTPTECGRLQGFPDGWTDGANGSDSAIYKMWGNGIALPCAADVIGRLANELRDEVKIQ